MILALVLFSHTALAVAFVLMFLPELRRFRTKLRDLEVRHAKERAALTQRWVEW